MRAHSVALLLGAALAAQLRLTSGCTVLGVGTAASLDGSTLTSHSDDGEYDGDARLCNVLAQDHAAGALRPVYYENLNYPRFVSEVRGPCYKPKPGEELTTPICEIPQVPHTYSYFESAYTIANEHGVGMSESTCSGMFAAKPKTMGGNACLGIINLGQLCLERTKTARECVQVMGDMAVEYGFYGGDTFEGGAESLLVNDKDDVWIFHVLPDDTLSSAIWAAQKIPKDHVTVIANMFTIWEIDFADSDAFMFSDSMKDIATKNGWWKPGTPFDFTKIYSEGEYSHKYYSGRRMWGAYLKWGLEFPEDYSDLRYDPVYPVSAKPNKSVNIRDLFSTHRWSYEGTKYSMADGLAAGPWGITDRWNNEQNIDGSWERSIAVYRTDYLSFTQIKPGSSIFWFGPHCAASSVFVPLDSHCTSIPQQYMVANPGVLDRQSVYWAHKYNFNVALMKYGPAMKNRVRVSQHGFEEEGAAMVAAGATCDTYYAHMDKVWKQSWALPDYIVATYADGWYEDGAGSPYPDWWLKAVGYQDGPPPVPDEPDGPCYPQQCPNKSLAVKKAAAPGPGGRPLTHLARTNAGPKELVAGPTYFELLDELEASQRTVMWLTWSLASAVILLLFALIASLVFRLASSKVDASDASESDA